MTPPAALPYDAVRSQIRDLDVIAWEGRGVVSRLIRLVTGGTVTHVGLAAWWGESLLVIESREWRGGRAVLLSGQIPADGVIVLRAAEPIDPQRAAEALRWAIGSTGAGYSYRGVVRFLRRVGLPLSEPEDDRRDRGARFCSELVSAVLRRAGIDPCPGLRDSETSPADLARSGALRPLWRAAPPA